jgi:hypothetical protein
VNMKASKINRMLLTLGIMVLAVTSIGLASLIYPSARAGPVP